MGEFAFHHLQRAFRSKSAAFNVFMAKGHEIS
jgi:hypothetical protein